MLLVLPSGEESTEGGFTRKRVVKTNLLPVKEGARGVTDSGGGSETQHQPGSGGKLHPAPTC